ncbi:hypothetical protein rosmuc_02933 [Roseovarius mucosus DSM 17069]|uniref:Uncharacterized protein n=1 Tax=Roseovarius mucosus DSM 17069 TaxID=1288298 RepID=A0A0A0HHM1_9RHOB|nr:hypothetical protein rosmuc_02933 [Roseovarius mucosus DSM 17069]
MEFQLPLKKTAKYDPILSALFKSSLNFTTISLLKFHATLIAAKSLALNGIIA